MAGLAGGRVQPVGKPDVMIAAQPAIPPQPTASTGLATGPYQGVAGSEAQNPGRQRQPHANWADPSDPNYERRNYYIHPDTGMAVAREPGYYNPDHPWDTGRPGEYNGEFRGMDIGAYERRMDEPGITPWGPGGKASEDRSRVSGLLAAVVAVLRLRRFRAVSSSRARSSLPGSRRARTSRSRCPVRATAILRLRSRACCKRSSARCREPVAPATVRSIPSDHRIREALANVASS
jgi:hypothetical protein